MGEAVCPISPGVPFRKQLSPHQNKGSLKAGVSTIRLRASLRWDGVWPVMLEDSKGYSHRASFHRSPGGAALFDYLVPSDVAERAPNSERS